MAQFLVCTPKILGANLQTQNKYYEWNFYFCYRDIESSKVNDIALVDIMQLLVTTVIFLPQPSPGLYSLLKLYLRIFFQTIVCFYRVNLLELNY